MTICFASTKCGERGGCTSLNGGAPSVAARHLIIWCPEREKLLPLWDTGIMKLSAYIIRFDTGFAPNPFGRHCTLACCKPTIRRKAEGGDIIVGIASARLPKPGRLVYAMCVKEVLPYQKYWQAPRFAYRKPSQATPITRRGDNIWHYRDRRWRVAPGAFHDESHRDRDISGEKALVATEFYYFGKSAIFVPKRFSPLLATTQGHKNTHDRDEIRRFWNWLRGRAPRRGRIDDPSEFTDAGCRAQCSEIEEDDFEET